MTDDAVITLADHRRAVRYRVDLVHHWDDRLEIFVHDVSDDERSRMSVADALERAAKMLRDPNAETARI